MAAKELIDDPIGAIIAEAQRLELIAPRTTWFLFGSMLVNPATANDIDLLVLYERDADGPGVRRELAALCLALPLHLMIVSASEEQELGILERYKVQKLYPPGDP